MMHAVRNFHKLLVLMAMLFTTGCSTMFAFTTMPTINNTDKDLGICEAAAHTKPVLIYSVMELGTKSSYGSGMWVHTPKGDNYFITNAHVVMDPAHLKSKIYTTNPADSKPYVYGKSFLYNEKGDKVEAEVVALSYDTYVIVGNPKYHKHAYKDIAILKAKELPESFTSNLTQHKFSTNKPDDITYVSGFKPYPDGWAKEITCKPTINGKNAITLTDPSDKAIQGQSGSALLNKNMEIVGVLASTGQMAKTSEGLYVVGTDDQGRTLLNTGDAPNPDYNVYTTGSHAAWILELLEKTP